MKNELTKEEWSRLTKILKALLEITWEYSELKSRNVSNNFEEEKPKRLGKEPYNNYNLRLLAWDKLKTESYSKTFNEAKSKSFNLITELETLLYKLGMPSK